MNGTPFGRYELVELLGRGGMGEVWKAFDTATQRVVAVKVLPAQLAADPVFEQRFRREAFTAAALTDPHVVPIHNFGEIDGRLYVDMRLIEGEDLEHVLTRGPLDPQRAVSIIEQIASALNSAHRVGLVHRDVKPSNILVAEDDFAYLIDFGIARGAGETGITGTGNVVGTWPYMAPERFTTGVSDTRSDIYALTCVLYECLTSRRPFPGDSVEQQIAGHLTTPPPRPSVSWPGVSSELDAVIAVGMAKDPAERFGTTTELAHAARTALTAAIANSAADPQHTAIGAAPSLPTEVHPTPSVDEASAATHTGPPEHVKKAWAATEYRPVEVEPTDWLLELDEAPIPWWRHAAVVIPAALLVAAAAITTVVVVHSGGESEHKQPGPLDGTYTVEFASATMPDGHLYPNAQGGRETWVIKSACPASGCVATASKVDGSQSSATTLVLDQIDGRWMSVSALQGTCQKVPTELWESMSLQPLSDGKMQGEFIVRSATNCARNQRVTFTRTGDVDDNVFIPDPAVQQSRVASPAQALHGRYQETDTYTVGGRSAQVNFDIRTYCLRSGQRCLSYWANPDDTKVLAFSGDQWVLANASTDATCTNGSPAHGQVTLQYPLPQPEQNPITLMTGRGHYTVTGDCAFSSDFDSRVQRTGD